MTEKTRKIHIKLKTEIRMNLQIQGEFANLTR